MTKKFLRIVCMVLVAIMLCGVLAGCSMFQLNEERYRNETAFQVGDTPISVGDFSDFISSTMANYISNGYDAQTVWDSVGGQLLMNYVVYDKIKADDSWVGVEQDEPFDTLANNYPIAQY